MATKSIVQNTENILVHMLTKLNFFSGRTIYSNYFLYTSWGKNFEEVYLKIKIIFENVYIYMYTYKFYLYSIRTGRYFSSENTCMLILSL